MVENADFNGNFGYFIDPRDNNKYKWVRIGSQIWMADNLRYEHPSGAFAYENSNNNINELGYLYTRKAALESCPDKWRLPIAYDFELLLKHFGTGKEQQINNMMKAGKKDFSLKLAGRKANDKKFYGLSSEACYWSSTENSQGGIYYLHVFSSANCIRNSYILDQKLKENIACSVRCVLRSIKEEEELIRDYMLNKFKVNKTLYYDIENAISALVNIAKSQGFVSDKANGYFTLGNGNIEAKLIGKALGELAYEGAFLKNGKTVPININILLGFVINKVEDYLPYWQHGQLKYLWKNIEGFNY